MEKPEEVEIRRAPKVLPWAITGAVIGLAFAALLYLVIPEENRSSRDILGLLLVALGSLGLGLGVAAALAVDLFTATRAKSATAVRTDQESD